MGNEVRRALPVVIYNKKEITTEISGYIKSLEIVDNLEGQFDSMKMTLINKNNDFMNESWSFEKGETISYALRTLNWEHELEGIKEAGMGVYYVDEKEYTKESAVIKGISAPLEATDVVHSKTWASISLKRLGEEIAKKYKLKYSYLLSKEINLSNLMQEKETDFSYLDKIAADEGVKVKVSFNTLILFDEEEYAKKESVTTLDLNKVTDFKLTDKNKDIYDAVEVSYFDTIAFADKRKIVTEAELRGKGKGTAKKVLKLKGKSRSGDLKRYALKKLEQANKRQIELEITDVGNRYLYAGCTFNIINSGAFNGKYMITQITKKLPGFVMKIKSYKVKSLEEEK